MTTEEEKDLDESNRLGIRHLLDTIMYMRDELHEEVPPEVKKEVIALIRLYGAICELEQKIRYAIR